MAGPVRKPLAGVASPDAYLFLTAAWGYNPGIDSGGTAKPGGGKQGKPPSLFKARPTVRRGTFMPRKKVTTPPSTPIYERIRAILESARTTVARTVNTTQVVANWLIGREIFEEEQRGAARAKYGEQLIRELSVKLKEGFGGGYGPTNLKLCRQFFLTYGQLLPEGIGRAARDQLALPLAGITDEVSIGRAARDQSWEPGLLHEHLSWTHYRILLRVEKPEARAFYEIEAIENNWSVRELERQINSLLYERLALSRDKKGLLRLARKGQEIQTPQDVFKDPLVIEFLGLPESPKLVETDLEEALLNHLQAFLLELGKGFAFVARQQRITLEGDHFYIDLVFYHTILKCYVLIDLKTGKLTHQDLGQLQLYVNYFDQERRTEGDQPTLGLILCMDKNDTVVRYTLGPDQKKQIFASRYQLYLPTEAELRAVVQRETRAVKSRDRKEGGAWPAGEAGG
jgi:predicted nuclease of restriction endonuclease-like (RecB) superfamily